MPGILVGAADFPCDWRFILLVPLKCWARIMASGHISLRAGQPVCALTRLFAGVVTLFVRGSASVPVIAAIETRVLRWRV